MNQLTTIGLLLIISGSLFLGCKQKTLNEASNQQTEQQEIDNLQEYAESTSSYQIDFDEVEYYSFEKLKIEQVLDIYDIKEEDRTEAEKLLLDFAFSYNISLADTSKLIQLNKIGYQKKNFTQSKSKLLKEYFAKDHYLVETACEHVYRDILILKTNNEITHFLKICFSCEDTQQAKEDWNGRMYLSYYNYLEKLLKEAN